MRAQASYTITVVKDGNDVDGITIQYIKTSSGTTAPSQSASGWSEEMPDFESGKYVWTRNKVVFIDPSDPDTPIVTYTDPVLDTAWKKLDELHTQGTSIAQEIENVTIQYYNSAGNKTTFKLSDGALDISFLKGQIDGAEMVATNFISINESGGIEVGNKTAADGSWSGYRTQMAADAFNILDASNNVVASYGANRVYLGKNDKDSLIDFCNGGATLNYNSTEGHMELTTPDGIIINGGAIISREFTMGAYTHKNYIDMYNTSIKLRSEITSGTTKYSSVSLSGNMLTLHADGEIYIKGKMSGEATGGSWYLGRDNAVLKSTSGTGTSAYFPVIDAKCNTGDWSIGTLGDNLYFTYTTDTNYNGGDNTTSKITFTTGGHILLPAYGTYQMTFGDGTEKVVAEAYYNSSSGYKAIIYGLSGAGIDGIYRGKDVELRANASIRLYPYYDNSSLNPYYWSLTVGVVNTSIGPCLRPMENGYCSVGANGFGFRYFYATNTGIQSTSDVRLKENISDDFSKLEKVFKMLRPVTYEYKHLEDDDEMRIGFVAQDVWETLIECGYDPRKFAAIHTEEVDPKSDLKEYIDTDETYYLNYTEFTALNTYMIQKLMKRVEALEKLIA